MYALNNVEFRLARSYPIQNGVTIRIVININPNGFQSNAFRKSPVIMDKTDLVDPHEGQGMLVMRLNIHAPGSMELVTR